jgi:serine/threonine protein kinase
MHTPVKKLEKVDEVIDEVLYSFLGISGAFGRVMGASNKSTGQEVAVKIIEKANCGEQDIRRINDEINTLYKFNHVSSNLR